jgi:hypothetical protein
MYLVPIGSQNDVQKILFSYIVVPYQVNTSMLNNKFNSQFLISAVKIWIKFFLTLYIKFIIIKWLYKRGLVFLLT